jgi:HK97 family phage portal protein
LSKPSVLSRVSTALRVLRGEASDERAIVPLTYPNLPQGTAQAVLVRTANPGEYKSDGATIRARGFNAHPVVHACIRVIADLVASVPLVVLRDRGDHTSRVPESHPLQALLNNPGPRFTARQFRARFAVDFVGYGNAMFHMERTGRRVTALRHINPESLQSVWVDAEGDPRRYDYGNWNGIIVTADAADVLHFRDLEMDAPFRPDVFGFPRGASALQSLMADYEAGHYVRQVVTNDGTPTFAVMLADEATQEDAQAMQDRYKARVVDRGKRGTPAFFGAVKDIKPLGFTLSDLEFPNLRKVAREDICAAFGVDPRMIGVASASNDAGLSGVQYVEARARLVQHTIEPLFAALEDELNHWLAPEFGDVYVAYDHDVLRDLVENDEATSKRIISEFDAGLRTWEESRTALKLSPMPEPTDAIKLTSGTTLTPAAVAVIDPSTVREPEPEQVGAALEDDPDEPDDEPDDDLNNEDEGRTLTRSDVDLPMDEQGRPWWVHLPKDQRPKRRASEAEKYAYWQRQVAEMDRSERTYYGAAKTLFAAERRDVGKAFGVPTRQDPVLAEIARRIAAGYAPGGEYYEAWREAYERLIAPTFIEGAKSVGGGGVNLGFDFTLQSPEVLRAIENRAARLAGFVGEETARQVTAAIRAGELGGLSVREIGRLIQASVYGESMTDTRATRIARTESAGAMSQGAWDQAQAMGDLYVAKEWLSFEDAKTRETHLACSAQGIIPIGDAFSNGLAYPLDPNGSAGEVINCRCVLAYYDTLTGD